MILTRLKEQRRLKDMLGDATSVLVVACNACTAVHRTGGTKEAEALAESLTTDEDKLTIDVTAVPRQCDLALVGDRLEPGKHQLILSTACGVGLQALATAFPDHIVLPAADTMLIGYKGEEEDTVLEGCHACGDCFVDRTAGLCPLARCPKGLLNGPCGGQVDGMCEVDVQAIPCVWVLIWRRLSALGRAGQLLRVEPPRDWRSERHPRTGVEGI